MTSSRFSPFSDFQGLTGCLKIGVHSTILAAIAVNAEDLVLIVLGTKWEESILPLQILCGVGALKSITPVTNNLLSGLGRTDIPFKFTLINLAVLPLTFWAGAHLNGIVGVSLAWMIGFPPICLWLIYQAIRETKSSTKAYLRALQFPALTSLACFIAMWAAGAMLPQGFVRLGVRSGVGIACYLMCLSVHARSRERMLAAAAKLRSRFA